MITKKCSAVLCLRNALTGAAVPNNCVRAVDDAGNPMKAEWRSGGYMVFIGLETGDINLVLKGPDYEQKRVKISVKSAGYDILLLSLVPKNVELTSYGEIKSVNDRRCFFPKTGASLKLIQDKVSADDPGFNVLVTGNTDLPYSYCFGEGAGAELVTINNISGGFATADAKLINKHKRGEFLRQCAVLD